MLLPLSLPTPSFVSLRICSYLPAAAVGCDTSRCITQPPLSPPLPSRRSANNFIVIPPAADHGCRCVTVKEIESSVLSSPLAWPPNPWRHHRYLGSQNLYPTTSPREDPANPDSCPETPYVCLRPPTSWFLDLVSGRQPGHQSGHPSTLCEEDPTIHTHTHTHNASSSTLSGSASGAASSSVPNSNRSRPCLFTRVRSKSVPSVSSSDPLHAQHLPRFRPGSFCVCMWSYVGCIALKRVGEGSRWALVVQPCNGRLVRLDFLLISNPRPTANLRQFAG